MNVRKCKGKFMTKWMKVKRCIKGAIITNGTNPFFNKNGTKMVQIEKPRIELKQESKKLNYVRLWGKQSGLKPNDMSKVQCPDGYEIFSCSGLSLSGTNGGHFVEGNMCIAV